MRDVGGEETHFLNSTLVGQSLSDCLRSGLLFGSFFFTMKPVDVDSSLPLRQQLREQYRHFIPEVFGTARNFAKLGAVYSLIECTIDRVRRSSPSSSRKKRFLRSAF